MGIHNLAKLIADQAPNATKDGEIANYFGRKIAIDASVFRLDRCPSVLIEFFLQVDVDLPVPDCRATKR